MVPSGRSVLRAWLKTEDQAWERDWFAQAREVTQRHFGRRVTLFAPLYVSSVCVNNCLYCGFRTDNPSVARRVLRRDEIRAEAEVIAAMGHQVILLVAGEHPRLAGAEAIAEAVKVVRTVAGIHEVRVEIMPLEVDGYRTLRDAGVRAVMVYQETYDRKRYAQAHPSGPKAAYEWRLGTPDRAYRGGLPRVGLGALLGLSDPAADVARLVRHARALYGRWRTWPSVSLPRLRPAQEAPWGIHPPHPVDDRTYLRLVAWVRLALPQAHLVLSTRESPALRDQLMTLGLGMTEISAASRTEVGGYTAPDARAGQFQIVDDRPVRVIVERLQELGYDLAYGGAPQAAVASTREP